MRILILKLSAIGDVLRTTSVLMPLKKRYPDARITWVTSGTAKDVLLANPYIEEVRSLENFDVSRDTGYDMVLSLDEDERAARIASAVGGHIAGFYYKDGKVLPAESAKEWFDMGALGEKPMNNILKKKNQKTYQEHMLNIISLPVTDTPSAEYPLIYTLTNEEKALSRGFVEKHGILPGDRVVGINTGAGERWQYKKWPIDKTCDLIMKLSKLEGVKQVLFGGPDEESRNKEIMRRTGDRIIDAGTNNTIRDFGAYINTCDILLTSDSLAMHIGIALNVYTIVFFGPTSDTEIELYGNGAKIVPDIDCRVCYKRRCDFKHTCMDAISVDIVYQAIVGSLVTARPGR